MNGRAAALFALWLVLIAAVAFGVKQKLIVSSDLRSFMPPAQNADQKLILDEIGEGPASRLLMIAISGAAPEQLDELSRGLLQALQADSHFSRVLNGDLQLAQTLGDATSSTSSLLPYRYLLSPTLDHAAFDAPFLRDQLEQRVEDLASPAAGMLKPLLARDPTLETLALAQRWTPAHAPQTRDGVWIASDGSALLLAETSAPGFDPVAQSEAIASLQALFKKFPNASNAQLTLSGAGYFGVIVSTRTRAEAEWLSALGTIGFVLLLLIAYRSPLVIAIAAVPIISGAVVGIAMTALIFGPIHGITLAFGFTLLGVAQEYPIRLLSHRRADATATQSLLGVWPLLRLAIVSACIAYVSFFASGVAGLEQLATFTITGLLIAGAATRWLLPAMLPATFNDVARLSWLERFRITLDSLPNLRWLPWALLILAIAALVIAPTPLWQNDLAALTPVPQELLRREGELRTALGAPDVRYLLALESTSADGVLALSEKLEPEVEKWKTQHLVDDIELPSRYLPSLATQRARQAKLPERAKLEADLIQAQNDLPFQIGLFAPFVDDVQSARALPLLTPQEFAKSPLGARLQAMLIERDGKTLGLGTLSGVTDFDALSKQLLAFDGGGHARLLDLKASSESLVASYRARIGAALLAALVLLAIAVAVAFRDVRRAWHVLAPMSLATLLVLAVLRAGGVSLSLFHLIALTLAAGLGLHYALFFERPVSDAAEARRTLHATIICVISAVLVFGLLATSTVPVLRAIGATVALGVAFHFCLSILMARNKPR
jgi:predicted exporter